MQDLGNHLTLTSLFISHHHKVCQTLFANIFRGFDAQITTSKTSSKTTSLKLSSCLHQSHLTGRPWSTPFLAIIAIPYVTATSTLIAIVKAPSRIHITNVSRRISQRLRARKLSFLSIVLYINHIEASNPTITTKTSDQASIDCPPRFSILSPFLLVNHTNTRP